jgi:quercetin dioxygenase-like cupin family protein
MTSAAHVPPATNRAEPPAHWLLGGRYTVLTSGAETGGRLAALETLVPPGAEPPPHVHDREDEGFLVLEGRLTLLVGDDEITLPAGAYALAPRGVPHTFRVEDGVPARVHVTCAPAGFEDFVAELGEPAGPGLPPPPAAPPDLERVVRVAGAHGIRFVTPS